MEKTIEDALAELKLEAETFFAKLDKQSEEIRETEKTLQELNINMPFRLCVLTEPSESGTKSAFIAWDLYQPQNKFRLLGVFEDIEGDITKPITEIPFVKKMKIIKQLPEFVEAFNNHLRETFKDL